MEIIKSDKDSLQNNQIIIIFQFKIKQPEYPLYARECTRYFHI